MENLEDMAFLEQSFNQLPTKGKRHLKELLESLISLQNSASQPTIGEKGSSTWQHTNRNTPVKDVQR
jgi:hypothetical protein